MTQKPTGYRLSRPVAVEESVPPQPESKRSMSPPGGTDSLEYRSASGSRIKVSSALIVGVITALGAAFAARSLPTATSTDRSIEISREEARLRELNDATFRAEQKNEMRALRDELRLANDAMTNRFVAIEAKLGRLEQAK